jgi:phthiocerol/phenolphthiocerol synthesis type-I polyketide synthase E
MTTADPAPEVAADGGPPSRDNAFDIAVTGISARFPGAEDLDAWWAALAEGEVLTTAYTRQELLDAGVAESLADSPEYVAVRGHLTGADRFDHTLFKVSPREAELTDPQHRLMLHAAWSAMEDAGMSPLGGGITTGVYASASGSGYLRAMLTGGMLDPDTLEQALRGAEQDYLATRIAYRLGLTGPALSVQTACSSSLVAVHLAVQALLAGDCDQALVVAAAVDFPQAGHEYRPGGIMSGAGACRPFDHTADGTLAGSGVAAVVLRRLADAVEDGQQPYAVILGTAINNDGAAKAGYHAPSAAGQEAVIRAALRAADVQGDSIGYLEAHATGTRVGDPIEWSGASAAYAGSGATTRQIAVGAVKANIGHLDAAAGLTSLIKAILVVRSGLVPPVAGFTELNPMLRGDDSPLFIPANASAWSGPSPRRAGVSSFGIGGTNAHVVIEQPPRAEPAPPAAGLAPDREHLLMLSAATPQSLDGAAARLAGHLRQAGPSLDDVSFTLTHGRAELGERLIVTGRDHEEIARALSRPADAVRGSAAASGPAPVAMLFPGQGSQRPGMALPYARALPGFPAALRNCLDAFDPATAERVRAALSDPEFPADELAETRLAQPAIFALQYAAFTALAGLGVTPAVVWGHSLGEVTAACAAGILDLPSAARFVTVRGDAMQACPPGAMLAVGGDEPTVRRLLAESGADLEIAALNGPANSVVAGAPEAVRTFQTWLDGRIFSRRLHTSHAFHSSLIEPAMPRLSEALHDMPLGAAAVPLVEGATGRLLPAGTRARPGTFLDGARRTVRFGETLSTVAERFPDAVVLEIGPGRSLSAPAEATGLRTVALSPARTGSEGPLAALGALWALGQPIDRAAVTGPGRRIHLPTYAFHAPRWIAPEAAAGLAAAGPRRSAAPAPDIAEPRSATGQDGAEPGSATGQDGAESRSADTAVPRGADRSAHRLVADLWTEFLGHEEPANDADFFDLGGDSLQVTRLANRIHQELAVRIPIREMMLRPSLGAQADLVQQLLDSAATGDLVRER